MMVKRKLEGAVDESSAGQEIHKSDTDKWYLKHVIIIRSHYTQSSTYVYTYINIMAINIIQHNTINGYNQAY